MRRGCAAPCVRFPNFFWCRLPILLAWFLRRSFFLRLDPVLLEFFLVFLLLLLLLVFLLLFFFFFFFFFVDSVLVALVTIATLSEFALKSCFLQFCPLFFSLEVKNKLCNAQASMIRQFGL